MATSAQITADRENAQHSAGPVTIDGKARSAANSTKHGLSGPFSILPDENPAEFSNLLDDLRRQHSPRNPFENFCVDSMAQAHWRLARARRLENRMLEQIMESNLSADPDSAIVAHMLDKGAAALNTLQRYAAEAERAYYRAHR